MDVNKNIKPKILIVDDSPVNIKILVKLLMDEFEISVATNGEEGIEIINSQDHFDLILLDITMPGMDGYEVCRRLKAQEQTKNIPVIFITARNEVEEETMGFEVGAVDYITKPFSPAIVRARIHTHLDLKRHRDNLVKVNELLKTEISERKKTEEKLRHLLKKQEIDIDLAKNLLFFVNKYPPRYIEFSNEVLLFLDVISVPCFAEGGDHFFVQTIPAKSPQDSDKTILSLKDQSGHEVGCVLRSIITDLIHHQIISENPHYPPETVVTDLNDRICNSNLFERDDFFTAISLEIDHRDMMLRFVSAGHPPLILIRNKEIFFLPEPGGAGSNIPIAVLNGMAYSVGSYQLQPGDKLICYTDGLMEIPLRNQQIILTLDDLKYYVEQSIHKTKSSNIPVSEIIDRLIQSIAEFSGEQVSRYMNTSSDDVSIIGLELEDATQFSEEIWMPKTTNELCCLIEDFYNKLQQQWRYNGFDDPETRFRIVLEEAVLNAWMHGNQKNPQKKISIRWRFRNDFHLEIIDQGDGFDYNTIPDPTSKDNLTKQTGRGLFIIKHFSDSVTWKDNGRRIIIRFKKRSDAMELR